MKRISKRLARRVEAIQVEAIGSGLLSAVGLTGDSGFIAGKSGVMHLSAPYDANGKVFAESPKPDGWWRRVTRKQARAWGWRVIPCAWCRRAAVRLDHHHPYMTGANACARHLERGFRDE